jgi:hypothetical protein
MEYVCANDNFYFVSTSFVRICPRCQSPSVMLIATSPTGAKTVVPVNAIYSNAPSAPALHQQTQSQGFMLQNPQFSPPPAQPQPSYVPPQMQAQNKMSFSHLLNPSSNAAPFSFPSAFQPVQPPPPKIQTFSVPAAARPAPQPTQTWSFISLSPSSVAASAQFTPSGNIDPNSLPAGFPNSRFGKYTDRIDAAPYPARLTGPDMHQLSAQKAPSATDANWNSQYATAAAGLPVPQKAAIPGQARAIHHVIKSADKLSSHLRDVGNAQLGATTSAQVTETGGEAATARYLHRRGYDMKLGFMKGAGIDQIWVKRNAQGTITEYAIVEAKGLGVNDQPAQLGSTADKGFQMSARWTYLSALALAVTTTNSHLNSTGRKILEAIETNIGVLVWGVCITEQSDRNAVEVFDCGIYNVTPPQLAAGNLAYWRQPLS